MKHYQARKYSENMYTLFEALWDTTSFDPAGTFPVLMPSCRADAENGSSC